VRDSLAPGTPPPGDIECVSPARPSTATYNGATYTPTLLTSGWNNGQTTIGASDGTRILAISGLNITANGSSYSAAVGNPNSIIVTWIDGANSYSSGYGGSGTLTFGVTQLGRVAGTFNVITKTVNGSASVTLVGLYDIKFP
jgi:hypothetical protein